MQTAFNRLRQGFDSAYLRKETQASRARARLEELSAAYSVESKRLRVAQDVQDMRIDRRQEVGQLLDMCHPPGIALRQKQVKGVPKWDVTWGKQLRTDQSDATLRILATGFSPGTRASQASTGEN
jgi:hypothetical protein